MVAGASMAILMLSACGAPAPTPAPTIAVAMEQPTDSAALATPTEIAMASTEMITNTEAMTSTGMMTSTDTMTSSKMLPAWQQVQLTDARTGKTFTLADFAGKTVYVEPFATWCVNCKTQLRNVQAARQQLGDKPVFVTLSVETNLKTEDITQYTNEQGFDWVFAVITPELLKQLTDEFGLVIATPPSTPHFIIRPDGSTTKLATGIKSVESLVSTIQAAGQ